LKSFNVFYFLSNFCCLIHAWLLLPYHGGHSYMFQFRCYRCQMRAWCQFIWKSVTEVVYITFALILDFQAHNFVFSRVCISFLKNHFACSSSSICIKYMLKISIFIHYLRKIFIHVCHCRFRLVESQYTFNFIVTLLNHHCFHFRECIYMHICWHIHVKTHFHIVLGSPKPFLISCIIFVNFWKNLFFTVFSWFF
jgi:hypothetical protein